MAKASDERKKLIEQLRADYPMGELRDCSLRELRNLALESFRGKPQPPIPAEFRIRRSAINDLDGDITPAMRRSEQAYIRRCMKGVPK
jgi:hypothetical protein